MLAISATAVLVHLVLCIISRITKRENYNKYTMSYIDYLFTILAGMR